MIKKLPVLFSLMVVFALILAACSPAGENGTETVPGDNTGLEGDLGTATDLGTDADLGGAVTEAVETVEGLDATETPMVEDSVATATVEAGPSTGETGTPAAGVGDTELTATPAAGAEATGPERDMNLASNIIGEAVYAQSALGAPAGDTADDMVDDSGTVEATEPVTTEAADGADDALDDDAAQLAAGEPIGTIDSLIVDSASGQIGYALLAPGAALEVDNDFVAVPWSLLQINQEDMVDDLDTDTDVTTDTTATEAADTADTAISGEDVAIVYTGDVARLQDPAAWVAEAQFEEGMQVAADLDSGLRTYWGGDVAALPQTGTDAESAGMIRLADVEDRNLVNAAGEDVGDIEDIILDREQGLIDYVIVATGGLLDIGEELVPVPFEMLSVQVDDAGNAELVLNAEQTDLEAAPRLASVDELPNTDEEGWDEEFLTFWEGIEPSTDTDDAGAGDTDTTMETPEATAAP